MWNLVCKTCKSTDVTQYTPGLFGDSRHKCNSCGNISFTTDFIEPTVFIHITESPEVLAEKLVYRTIEIAVNRVVYSCWKSTIADGSYRTQEDAIAATVAKLQEVYAGQTTSNNQKKEKKYHAER